LKQVDTAREFDDPPSIEFCGYDTVKEYLGKLVDFTWRLLTNRRDQLATR